MKQLKHFQAAPLGILIVNPSCHIGGDAKFCSRHWYDCPRWVAGEQPAARLELSLSLSLYLSLSLSSSLSFCWSGHVFSLIRLSSMGSRGAASGQIGILLSCQRIGNSRTRRRGESQNSIEFLLWLASCPGIDTPRVRDLWVSCGIHPKVLQARVWKELLT